jgi:uncharacterized membrane protein
MSTTSDALGAATTIAGVVGVGAALYAVFGPRQSTQKAAQYTVGAVLVGAGASFAFSLLQGSSLQLPSATTGTGRLPPVPV